MRSLLLAFLFVAPLAGAPVSSAQPTAIVNIAARKTTSLNGKWKTIVDLYENGFYDFRMQEDKNGYFRNAKRKTRPIAWNTISTPPPSSTSPAIGIPQRDSLFFYEGTVWYRQMFDYAVRPATSPLPLFRRGQLRSRRLFQR